MIDSVEELRGKHIVALVRDERACPIVFGTEVHAFVYLNAFAVVESAVDIFDGLNLTPCKTIVTVDILRAHPRSEIDFRFEVARQRIIDDTILDAVLCIALRNDSVAEDVNLRQTFRNAVAVLVEREIAGKIVGENFLSHPDVRNVQRLIIEHRRA